MINANPRATDEDLLAAIDDQTKNHLSGNSSSKMASRRREHATARLRWADEYRQVMSQDKTHFSGVMSV